MTFAIIDWVFCLVIVSFAIIGIIKGFIDNIFGKLAIIAGLFIAYLFYKDLAEKLLMDIKITYAANIIAFVLIFVVVFLTIKIIQMIISKVFEWSILKSLDRTLGFFFGIVEGCAVVVLFIFIIDAQPFFDSGKLFEGSYIYNLILSFITVQKDNNINV